MSNPTGEQINESILNAGCFALTNLNGTHIFFYPRRKLPHYLDQYLRISDERRALLRDFLFKLPRSP